MNMVIGIDFTGSNLNRATGVNLHDKNFQFNQYFITISEISKIVLAFDTDKEVPMFGFGAIINEAYYSKVSDCFALNGNIFRPEAIGFEGIEQTYKNAIGKIMLAGPTRFAPILKLWNEMVIFESSRNSSRYYTFLLLTDGRNLDINETIEQVVISSSLPISTIIVGIGDADFSNMSFLDSDTGPLFSQISQTFSQRDNIQFVEFNKFKHDSEKFAREVLFELPRQMVSRLKIFAHFHSSSIFPAYLNASKSLPVSISNTIYRFNTSPQKIFSQKIFLN